MKKILLKCFWIGYYLYFLSVVMIAFYPKPIDTISSNDKVNHILAFAVFAIINCFMIPSLKLRHLVLKGVYFGFLIEMGQYFLPNRYFSFLDILADSAGIIVGYMIYRIVLVPFKFSIGIFYDSSQ